ncbi:Putative mushroom body large-type Kenyon cell-spe cific protein 1 [Trichuris trichiura]|uniref:Putative mushroom body large-type Kenyon cell-spe cific protein 1 n=1 Tax=Trichuris trichiura TaxID=36087 RepID=A0A077Z9H2_TRITR|nr:Putative mushroom body large-type Kenyon cell-spe cific protein 1 [Trichuris trichiura]
MSNVRSCCYVTTGLLNNVSKNTPSQSIVKDTSTLGGSRRTYSKEDLEAAVLDIRSGRLGTRRASVIYGVPRSTLRNKIHKLEVACGSMMARGGHKTNNEFSEKGRLESSQPSEAAAVPAVSPNEQNQSGHVTPVTGMLQKSIPYMAMPTSNGTLVSADISHFCPLDDPNSKKMRRKRGQYRKYDKNALALAVQSVRRGEMSVHKAGSFYGVPHSTLEYKVKERNLLRAKKQAEATANAKSLVNGITNDSSINESHVALSFSRSLKPVSLDLAHISTDDPLIGFVSTLAIHFYVLLFPVVCPPSVGSR